MRFHKVDSLPSTDRARNLCYLIYDNWDDYSFKTSFYSVLYDSAGVGHKLGGIKILQKGMTSGRVPVPSQFDVLDQNWCSLGNTRDYYVTLMNVEQKTREDYLASIRDCAFNQSIWLAFRNEEGMRASLLRGASTMDVTTNFPRILNGDSRLTPYEFVFEFKAGDGDVKERCEFAVKPDSKPPSNVHVLIGRNGVGKTRLLAGMVDDLIDNSTATIGLNGSFTFEEAIGDENEFLNIVVVSYSAFDRFDPIFRSRREAKKSIPYYYIGLKKRDDHPEMGTPEEERIALKTSWDFTNEFQSCLETIKDRNNEGGGFKHARWRRALTLLRSDPGLADFADRHLGDEGLSTYELSEHFSSLSSGHKIVLLTIARLVEYVSDRSLVLIDEPETHLHPPLLGSFVRAISELLISQNAVAIVATHSPVVLQEVPSNCVSVITRSGSRIRIRRPRIETFAENVSVLTRKIFVLEVQESGFYRLLKDASEGRNFDEVIEEFDQKIGTEGRALARAFTIEDEDADE